MNIVFKKIWKDYGFFQVEIFVQNKWTYNAIRTYIEEEMIVELSNAINKFVEKGEKCCWEYGEKGSETNPYIMLEFISMDNFGKIKMDVYMDAMKYDYNENEESNYCISFPLKTEKELLKNFAMNLSFINDGDVGTVIELNKPFDTWLRQE